MVERTTFDAERGALLSDCTVKVLPAVPYGSNSCPPQVGVSNPQSISTVDPAGSLGQDADAAAEPIDKSENPISITIETKPFSYSFIAASNSLMIRLPSSNASS